ncbi:MAG: PA0069 family radical SAM protein [Rhodospirillales bacterium]|nr:PA0069 family radical SAM protein [Rhodospirillales bacterium]
MDEVSSKQPRKGRGAVGNPSGRFESLVRVDIDDGWRRDDAGEPVPLPTVVTSESCRTIISRNQSPDVPFDRSINPYRGCEHGCVYCFARPTHAYLGLSPGLDFETRLFAKDNAPEVLERELRAKNYAPRPITLGANTDPYQPVERTRKITRGILDVLSRFNHPVAIVTKSKLITRDIDILAPMAARGLATVGVSVTTLNPRLAGKMEPRASAPKQRLVAIRELRAAGIRVSVLVAPIIPFINDHEIESILAAAARNGAGSASFIFLRLPHELKELFSEWLRTHVPLKAERVLARIRDCRDGELYESRFGSRMTGSGPYAELLEQRFRLACRRFDLGYGRSGDFNLDCSQFKPPSKKGDERQLSLF